MPTERGSPRDIDTRTESLDEPTGSIEFGPRRAAIPTADAKTMGHEPKPPQSSNSGHEDAAVRKAGARYPGDRPRRESAWRRFLRSIRSLGA